MATLRIADAARNQMLDQLTALIDAGAVAGTIRLYTGTMPADADDPIAAQVLLATLTFSDPSAPAASGGVLTFSAITEDASADATGVAAWARIEDNVGNNVLDADVTVTGGGGTIEMNTVNIVVAGVVRISSFTVTISIVTVSRFGFRF